MDVRANAIAKLKRAASLPRMRDGRRVVDGPAGEGADGLDGGEQDDRLAGPARSLSPTPARSVSRAQENSDQELEGDAELPAGGDAEPDPESDTAAAVSAAAAAPTKKRIRSRSRSRSKQRLKQQQQQQGESGNASGASRPSSRQALALLNSPPLPPVSPPLSPPPTQQSMHAQDGAQDGAEPPSSLPAFDHPPPLGNIGLIQSPVGTPMFPFMPGVPGPVLSPGPGSPAWPSLEEIRNHVTGLQRSASAAARTHALHKLTGGRVDPDIVVQPAPPSSPSPPPAAPRAALNRSNTVGGERVAVGRNMILKLGTRGQGAPEAETSGEEIVVPVSPSPKRRRRRSSGGRRRSVNTSIVDDRDPTPATPGPPTPSTPGQTLIPRLTPTPSSQFDLDYRGVSPAVSTTHILERDRDSALARLVGEDHFEFDHARAASRRGQRGPVIEDDYNEDYAIDYGPGPSALQEAHDLRSSPAGKRAAPLNGHTAIVPRRPHASDAPTFTTTTESSIDSTGDRVPLYLEDSDLPSPYKQDVFPQSPFGTPMREREASDIEMDLTQDSYVGSSNGLLVPWKGPRQNTTSWQTFPDVQYQITDESEDDLAEPTEHDHTQLTADDSTTQDYGQVVNTTSYRDDLDITPTTETPVERVPSPDKRANGTSTALVSEQATDDKPTLALPLTVLRPDSVGADWEEIDPNSELTLRNPAAVAAALAASAPPSTWDKLKASMSRNDGSASPMSRSQSRTAGRAGHASQLSTDSVASSSSGRFLPSEINTQQPFTPPTQTSSAAASTTILPLPPPSPFTVSGPSPMPPASPADRAKYADSKLQPFPALAAMARKRGLSISQSTPDVSLMTTASGRQTPVSPMTSQFDDGRTERPGLMHQSSDSKLLTRFQQPAGGGPPSAFSTHANRPGLRNAPSLEYIDLPVSPQQKSASSTKSGKFKWMQKMRGGSSSSITLDDQRPPKQRKPSLADLLSFKKQPDTATNGSGHGQDGRPQISHPIPMMEGHAATMRPGAGAQRYAQDGTTSPFSTGKFPNRDMHNGRVPFNRLGSDETTQSSSEVLPRTSQSDAVQDSSAEDSLTPHSTAESFASPQSERSMSGLAVSPKSSGAMLRFEALLSAGAFKMMEAPPRKLLFMSSVQQVVSVNSVKNRVLFLFNDILVVAQPAIEDESPTVSGISKPLLDRRYEVRNVIELHRMRVCLGRDDSVIEQGKGIVPRPADVQMFIREFSVDPAAAVDWLLSRAGVTDNPTALGKFLFETVELDRAILSLYLAERENRPVLKAFIDCFGFSGVRVDTALRIFLLALSLPFEDPPATEMLLGVFAGRWFDLNSGAVAYDRELTARLVRSIVSLNDAVHPPEPLHFHGIGYPPPPPQISVRHFIDACRQYDPAGLISDDVLAGIYRSIIGEQLRQAPSLSYRHSRSAGPLSQIKAEGLPSRLTYRVPSDPILVRISYPDPYLIVNLQGKDLLFDPPVLRFDKSREASFRVTGASLGVKSMIMYYGEARASEYSGLPFSTNVTVERAYMKPVFQIAFPSGHGPRRYMFSVDDPQILQDWMHLLQLHVSTAAAAQQHRSPQDADALYRASEAVAIEAMRACIGTTYRGHDLVILAQQNSIIPSVLSMLKGA